MYPLPALTTPLPDIAVNNKVAANNNRIPLACVLLTLFPKIPLYNEEVTGFINQQAIGIINEAVISAIKA